MRLHQLSKTTLRKRTRWGRGFTRGKNAGRGIKGQKSRSGVSHAHTFEGGRTPLKRMLPKNKGMKSLHTKRAAVNLGDLNGFAKDSVVTVRDVRAAHLVPSDTQWLKILAGGELKHALTVHAHAIAAAAEKKLQAVGGKFHAIAVPSKLTKKQRERLAKKATA